MSQSNIFVNVASSNLVAIPEDYSDYITHLAPWDAKLLAAIGMDSLMKPCSNPTHHYLEIEERPKRTTLNGAVASGATTFIFTDAIFSAGELVQVNEEVVLLGSTSNNLTFTGCTRSCGTGADANQADGDFAVGLGVPTAQGSAAGSTSDHVIMPNDVTTYSQIFSKDVVVSGTANALDRYGRQGSEVDYIRNRQLSVIKHEMEAAMLWGYSQAPSTTATAGQFDGIYERVAGVSNTTDLGGLAPSIANMEAAVQTVQDYGSNPDLLVCGLYTKRVIDSWGLPYIQKGTAANEATRATYGVSVDKLFLGGAEMDVLVVPNVTAHVFVLNSEHLGFGPLQGRAMQALKMGVEGDRVKEMVIGEYTFECPAPRGNYILTSCKVS